MPDYKIGIIGGRGYAGAELIGLIDKHPKLGLAFVGSRSTTGGLVSDLLPQIKDRSLEFSHMTPRKLPGHGADLYVLAVPDGAAGDYVAALGGTAPILDFSADHRSDPAWQYGLPEQNRGAIAGARLVANPGCYATAAQLALMPVAGAIKGMPAIFGVSGWSGAGRTPSPRNDPERLLDNLMPYRLSGHGHEGEIGARLGLGVRFMPHVAAFFRGISCTLNFNLRSPASAEELRELYRRHYKGDKLISISAGPPEIRDLVGRMGCKIGGFAVDGRDARNVTLVSVLDNLLKGAASQALQNINLMLGLDEYSGLE